ncbi:MAG: hypothetical protein KDB18_00490, partial [Salinibacterium sp.]|nr:hypothetical protein [Salinibacterium sp.]
RHRAVLTFGQDGPAFAAALRRVGVPVTEVGDLSAAVSAARTLARPGDAVLLSPACASFDAYLNFRERALAFRRCLPPLASLPPLAGPPP